MKSGWYIYHRYKVITPGRWGRYLNVTLDIVYYENGKNEVFSLLRPEPYLFNDLLISNLDKYLTNLGPCFTYILEKNKNDFERAVRKSKGS